MPSTRSKSKKAASKQPENAKEDTKSSTTSKKIQKSKSFYAEAIYAIYSADEDEKFFLAKLLEQGTKPNKAAKGIYLEKIGQKQGVATYHEGDEIKVNTEDILTELEYSTKKAGTKKKAETHYLVEVDEIESKGVKSKAKSFKRKDNKKDTEETEPEVKTPVKKRGAKKQEEPVDDEEESEQEDDEKEEDDKEDVKEGEEEEEEKETPRKIKKAVGRKNHKGDEIEVEEESAGIGKRSLRARKDKNKKEEEEVSRVSKKQKGSTAKAKGTKKEVLDEPEEEENEEEEESEDDEEEEEPKKTKRKASGKKMEEEESEEGTTDEEDEESEDEKPKRGRGRPKGSSAKKTKGEESDEDTKPQAKRGRPKKGDEKENGSKGPAKEKKKGKETAQFKRGKFNNNVEVVDICDMLQNGSDHVIDYESVKSNNKNLIRAVYTENHTLLDEILTKDSFTSNLFQPWGAETDFNAVEIAFKNNDKYAISKILECATKNELKMAREPPIGLKKIDTGYVSEYTFGVKVTKVATARGGREGNNAFIADNSQVKSFRGCIDKIARYDFDPEIFENLKLQIGDHEAISMFKKIVLAGNRRLATHIAEYVERAGGWNLGILHVEALKCSTVAEMSPNIMQVSVTQGAYSFGGITPLHCACINPNKEILEHLLQISPFHTYADDYDRKPIHFAASCDGTGPLEVLITAGVDINEPDQNGLTPLMYAAYNGRAKNVKLLLEDPRINRDYKMKDRTAAIHWAALRGHMEVLKVFKQNGADMNLKGMLQMTPLMLAAAYGHYDCVEFLFKNGAKINTRDRMKRNALVMAVRNGNLKIASYLLKYGSDFDMPDSSDNSPMHYAAAYGFPECISLLIKADADCNSINSWNLTPLVVAMLKNNFHCVKTLLALPNINIECKDEDGRTLIAQIILELTKPTFEHLKFLVVDKKADMSITDRKGFGPLHHACVLDTTVMAKRSYDFGDLTAEEQKDAIKECLNLKVELIDFLIKSGADVNQKTDEGEQPIYYAFKSGHKQVINTLLDHPNIDLLSANKNRGTIFNYLDFAERKHSFQLFEKILERTGNQNNILNNKIIIKVGPEYSEQTILSLYLKSFIASGDKIYQKNYDKRRTAWIENYRKQNALSYYQNVDVPSEVQEELKKAAQKVQNTFIENAVKVLDKLIQTGCEIPAKPYPLYQTYNSSSYPFILWIFKNFDKKFCDFNAKKTVGERPVIIKKSILHYLVESMPNFYGWKDYSKSEELKNCFKGQDLPERATDFRLLLELFHKNKVDFQVKTQDEKTPALIFTSLNLSFSSQAVFELFKDLDHYKIDVSSADKEGNTPILDAAHKSWTEIVEYLAQIRGVDINVADRNGKTVLHYYVEKKDAEGVERAIKVGANPEVTDLEGRTPLHLAISRTHPGDMFEVESVLLRNGANVNTKDNLGRTPLHFSFLTRDGKQQQQGTHHDAVECFANFCDVPDVNLDIRDARGKTALHYASATGAYGSVMFLLNKKATVDIKDVDGNTALALALYRGHKELASILIQNGASVHNKLEVIVEEKVLKGAHKMKNVLKKATIKEEDQEKKAGKMEEEEETETLTNWRNRGEIGYYSPVRSSFFAIAIRENWQGVAYLLLQNGYNLMEAIKDAFEAGEFRYVLALIHKAMTDDILKHTDDKHRNLFHIFAQKKSQTEKTYEEKTFQQLLKRGIDYKAVDIDNKTPLHYAAENNYQFLEYELLKLGVDANIQDKSGKTPLARSLVNDHLSSSKLKTYSDHGADITKKFSFRIRDKNMQIGPVVYLTSGQSSNKKELLKECIALGASVNETDEDGWTGLIYAIRQNSLELVQLFLSYPDLDVNLVDNTGRTPIHHVVNPLEYGSYENVEMLRLLSTRFDVNKVDKRGKAPIFYAYQQDSGVMISALKELKAIDVKQKGLIKRQATSIIASASWPEEVDYERDAEKYVEIEKKKEMEEVKEDKVKPDQFANNANRLEVVKDDKLGAYSLYMTKVNVRKGGYGEYLFYRMQVVHDANKDEYILFTRWGRIGEDGGYQNTPFSNKEKCIAEFKKIFFEKSRNQWDNKENFERVPGKYRLLDLDNQKKVHKKEYLKPIDFKDEAKNFVPSQLPLEVQEFMKVLANVNIYKTNFRKLDIDSNLLPFGQISKELIFEARTLLIEIARLIDESDKASKAKVLDIPAILKLKEGIAEKSSRFYELIPNIEFYHSPVQPIDLKSTLSKQSLMVDSLLDYEMTSKILLGALYNAKTVHPLDYCFNALSIKLLPLTTNHPEYQLIQQYIKNGFERSWNQPKIQGIFAVERKGEVEKISQWRHLKNRMYLWHGSKVSNLMSIFNQGLRIAPAEAMIPGAWFGRGISFADVISQALDSSSDDAARSEGVQFQTILLCEVALGDTLKLYENKAIEELEAPYKSVVRIGSYRPHKEQQVVLVNGARVPIGKVEHQGSYHKIEENGVKRTVYIGYEYNEYVVHDVSQIRMRYVIQLKK